MGGSGCVMKLNSVEDVFVKIKCMIQKLQQEAAAQSTDGMRTDVNWADTS